MRNYFCVFMLFFFISCTVREKPNAILKLNIDLDTTSTDYLLQYDTIDVLKIKSKKIIKLSSVNDLILNTHVNSLFIETPKCIYLNYNDSFYNKKLRYLSLASNCIYFEGRFKNPLNYYLKNVNLFTDKPDFDSASFINCFYKIENIRLEGHFKELPSLLSRLPSLKKLEVVSDSLLKFEAQNLKFKSIQVLDLSSTGYAKEKLKPGVKIDSIVKVIESSFCKNCEVILKARHYE